MRLPSALLLVACLAVLGVLTPGRAMAYPSYHPNALNAGVLPPDEGLLGCQNCHASAAGGGGCAVPPAVTGNEPCFNAFGHQYRSAAAGWASVANWDADGDGRTNNAEMYTDLTLPGMPNGAEGVACDFEACARNGSATCANNVLCSSSRNVVTYAFGAAVTRVNYTFAFSCAANTSGSLSSSDSNWTTDCADINECAGSPCGVGATSCTQIALGSWVSPGYTCACAAGYASNGTTCVVTDDCVASVDDCVGLATCGDTAGAGNYTCTCPSGYGGDGRSSGSGCTDTNECAGNPCAPFGTGGSDAQGCTQIAIGSWTSPGYTCACQLGYASNGTTCVLADECTASLDDCHAVAACADPTSAASDYTCTCPSGYLGDGHTGGSGCTNIDECALSSLNNCHADADCMDTAGSFVCACQSGYSGDGVSCANIDECADPIFAAMCDGQATCNDLVGSFECNCNAGYRGDGFSCADIDECGETSDDCHADATCANTPGSFTCSCDTGYSGDGRTCADIDECADVAMADRCSSVATCNNLAGSFECVCATGFEGDGFNCADVDECLDPALNECHAQAACTNEVGDYSCACNSGYEGSGVDCRDVDECSAGVGGCGLNEVCVNQVGIANTCDCTLGFSRLSADGACERYCGDGVRGPGEACDDGAQDLGDGCDPRCNVEAGWACYEPMGGASVCTDTCGDGRVDAAEECDEGAGNSDVQPDTCRSACDLPSCGDGVVDQLEGCDEGLGNSDQESNACRLDCQPAFCGDGIVDEGEVCDHGDGVRGASVAGACTVACLPDGGLVEPGTGAELRGGACAISLGAGRSERGPWALGMLALLGLVLRRRRRS